MSLQHTTPLATDTAPWSRTEFETRLRALEPYYHIQHAFQQRMNSGQSDRRTVQMWVANRFYYQLAIPLKDAAFLSNCPDRAVRREWMKRILDHDGQGDSDSGIDAWLRLAEAVGLQRQEVEDCRHVLPGVRFAVDAYVQFVRRASWQEAACASLTELFAPSIHRSRLQQWPQHYPWIERSGYDYFRKRLGEARRDVEHGLRITLDHFQTAAQQQQALSILRFKLDVLWTMLDCMWLAYIEQRPPYHGVV